MKYVNNFENFLNEIKGSFTVRSRADSSLLKLIETALKGNIFYYADLGKKAYMKPNGKRTVQAEKFHKNTWLTTNQDVKELDDEISFEYNYETFTVSNRDIKKCTAQEYLEGRLEYFFSCMHANSSSDWNADADAAAAGTYAFKPNDNVSPYVDCGFIVWFADKYKINLKKFMDDNNYTMSYNEVIDYAKKYPYHP